MNEDKSDEAVEQAKNLWDKIAPLSYGAVEYGDEKCENELIGIIGDALRTAKAPLEAKIETLKQRRIEDGENMKRLEAENAKLKESEGV